MSLEAQGFRKLSSFQQHFFYRELNEFSTKIFITAQLDSQIELSAEEIKQKIILKLLANEPLLRARIYYINNETPMLKIHTLEEFKGELLDGLLEVTDLKMDSGKFLHTFAESAFPVNKDINSAHNPNWKILLNYKENFIGFLYSHVLFDGISGVSAVNSFLSLLNGESEQPGTLAWNSSTGVLDPYPVNKEVYNRPLNLKYDDLETPYFDVANVKVKPNTAIEGSHLVSFQDGPGVSKIIRECKARAVSLNSFIVAMLAISTYDGKDVKCKFAMPVDLRERLQIDGAIVPKSTLGLLITFIANVTPTITSKEIVNGSEAQWLFIQKVHDLIQLAVPIAVDDLREVGNNNYLNQEKLWVDKKERSISDNPELPTFTFVLSNLSLNFKHDSSKKYNVVKSIFSQAKRPPDFFSCSMISYSGGFSISAAYYEDVNHTMSKCIKRFENMLETKRNK